MQKCNKSLTPHLASYVTKIRKISIYLAVNFISIYTTDERSYRHTNFTILLKRNANTHALIVSNTADTLMNDIKEHLVEIETINHLLREQNQHLKRENISKKNNLKVGKTNNPNNVQSLRNKNKKDADKIIRSKQKVI